MLDEFGSLENLLKEGHTIPQNKRREAILGHKDQARLSKTLVTLKTDVHDILPAAQMRVERPDPAKVEAFLDAQGFHVLKKRLFDVEQKPQPAVSAQENTYELVTTAEGLKTWADRIKEKKSVAFDILETPTGWETISCSFPPVAFD